MANQYTLQEALEIAIGPSPHVEPLDTIGAIARVFAREPGGNTKGYVTNRMAASTGVSIRTAQRWITPHGAEVRNPSKPNLLKLQEAALESRGKYHGETIRNLHKLEATGAAIDMRATIAIDNTSGVDVRHRTIRDVHILPDGHMKRRGDRMWQQFIDNWRIGHMTQDKTGEGALDWFIQAYFNALGGISGILNILNVEWLTVTPLGEGKKTHAA